MRRSTPLLVATLLAASAFPVRAVPLPEVMTEVGRTFAVDSAIKGVFDQGGFSATIAALWPVEDRLRIGVSLFADDAGSWTSDLGTVLEFLEEEGAPMDTLPVSAEELAALGVFNLAHVNIYGAAWRLEAVGPRLGRVETFGRGEWGLYQFHVDQNGAFLLSDTKLGWNLAGGFMLPLRGNQAVGVTVGFDRVFHDFFRDYMSASLAWHWRPSAHSRAGGSKQ